MVPKQRLKFVCMHLLLLRPDRYIYIYITGNPGVDNIETQPMVAAEAEAYAAAFASSPPALQDKSPVFHALPKLEDGQEPAGGEAGFTGL